MLEELSGQALRRALESPEMQKLVRHAEKEYVYWDKFKHYTPPTDFSIEEAWAFLKFSRLSNRECTPIRDKLPTTLRSGF